MCAAVCGSTNLVGVIVSIISIILVKRLTCNILVIKASDEL